MSMEVFDEKGIPNSETRCWELHNNYLEITFEECSQRAEDCSLYLQPRRKTAVPISNTALVVFIKSPQSAPDCLHIFEHIVTLNISTTKDDPNHVSNCHFCKPPLWPSFFGALGAAGFRFAF